MAADYALVLLTTRLSLVRRGLELMPVSILRCLYLVLPLKLVFIYKKQVRRVLIPHVGFGTVLMCWPSHIHRTLLVNSVARGKYNI
jgi:hypothetical protein